MLHAVSGEGSKLGGNTENDDKSPDTPPPRYSRRTSQRTPAQKRCDKWRKFFGIGLLELRGLDFKKLAAVDHPGRAFKDLNLFEQVELIRRGLKPDQCLIHPHCRYIKYWDTLVLSALIYTSIVTPYEVGFLETSMTDALFYFNRIIDVVFFKDIILQFFLKVQIRGLQGTRWIRDRKALWKKYLTGWFFLDFVSILPFDILGAIFNDPAVQSLKIVRIVRLLRLLKLVRVLRASRIIKRWQNRVSISFASQGLMKFTIMLILMSHWMACVWGLTGRLLGTNLTCDLHNNRMYVMEDRDEGISWLTSKTWRTDSPCDHISVYMASLHFAVMTITSIGYGDITPTRNEEYIVGIACQFGGGMVWAYIIGSICGIIANADPTRVQFEQSMDALNMMLHEQGVSDELRISLREYLREQQYHHFLIRARSISDMFSPELQASLILETLIGTAIKKVWYFRKCETTFVMSLARSCEAEQFAPREKIGGVGTLSIIQRGSVAWCGRILLPGNFWGEDMILTSQFLAQGVVGVALTFAEILSLRRKVMEQILQGHPDVISQIRKAAVTIAFRRAVWIMAQDREREKHNQGLRSHTGLRQGSHNNVEEEHIQKVRSIFDGLSNVKASAETTSQSRRSNRKSVGAADSPQQGQMCGKVVQGLHSGEANLGTGSGTGLSSLPETVNLGDLPDRSESAMELSRGLVFMPVEKQDTLELVNTVDDRLIFLEEASKRRDVDLLRHMDSMQSQISALHNLLASEVVDRANRLPAAAIEVKPALGDGEIPSASARLGEHVARLRNPQFNGPSLEEHSSSDRVNGRALCPITSHCVAEAPVTQV